MNSNVKKLITIDELACILCVPKSRIRYFIFKNQIPYLKIGKSIRFDINEIIQWLSEKRGGLRQNVTAPVQLSFPFGDQNEQ